MQQKLPTPSNFHQHNFQPVEKLMQLEDGSEIDYEEYYCSKCSIEESLAHMTNEPCK